MKKIFDNVLFLLLYAIIATLALRGVLLNRGTIGFAHDWSIPPYPSQILQSWQLLRSIWTDGQLGGEVYFVGYLGYLPMLALASVGVGGEAVSKGYTTVLLAFSGFGIYFFCKSIGLPRVPAFLSGLFYMFAPMPFNRLAAGHLYHLFGYSLTPVALAFYLKASASTSSRALLRNTILSGISYALSATQLQFSLIIFGLMLGYSVASAFSTRSLQCLKRYIAVAFGSSVIAASFYLPWILSKFADFGRTLSVGAQVFSSRDWLSWQLDKPQIITSIELEFGLLGYFQTAILGNLFWIGASAIIALLALSAPLFAAKTRFSKHASLWGVAAVGFIFLSFGSRNEFSQATWDALYNHLRPLLAFTGELENIMYVPTMAYAVLLGITLQRLLGALGSKGSIFGPGKGRGYVLSTALASLLVVSYAVPSFTHYSEMLQTFNLDESYKELYELLSRQDGMFRVLLVPPVGEYGASLPGLKRAGVDLFLAFPPRLSFPQFFHGFTGARWSPYHNGLKAYTNFVVTSVYRERTENLGYLLSFAGTKHVLIRDDVENVGLKVSLGLDDYKGIAKANLLKQRDLRLLEARGPLTLLENVKGAPMIDVVDEDRAALIVGGLSTLVTASYVSNELPEPRLAVFASQLRPADTGLVNTTINTVIIDPYQYEDLIFGNMLGKYRIYPAEHLEQSKDWSTVYWPKEWQIRSDLNDPVLVEVPATLKIQFHAPETSRYVLLAKIYFGPTSSAISLNLDGNPIASVNTTSPRSEFYRWVTFDEINLTEGYHSIEITSRGLKEGVALLLVAPEYQVKKAWEKTLENLSRKSIVVLVEAEKPTRAKGWDLDRMGSSASSGESIISTNGTNAATYRLIVPREGSYSLYVRSSAKQAADLHLDLLPNNMVLPSKFKLYLKPSGNFTWSKLPLGRLEPGEYSLHASVDLPGVKLDMLALADKDGYVPTPTDILSSSVAKIDQTRYQIYLKNTAPAFVIHSESYNPFWSMVDEQSREVPSLIANGFARAYYIEAGVHQLSLSYRKQQFFELGWWLTLISYAALTVCMIRISVMKSVPSR